MKRHWSSEISPVSFLFSFFVLATLSCFMACTSDDGDNAGDGDGDGDGDAAGGEAGDGDGEAGDGDGGDGDSEPATGAESLACCQSQLICENCACGSGEDAALSEDQATCQQFLNDGAGCGNYSKSSALADCANGNGSYDPSDTSGGESDACCIARNVCENCACGNGEAAAFSENEELCQAFLDQGAGCGSYPLSQAAADCGG